ncbi:ArnT family glycosyltransferase [Nakamurella lactea]|uniref:ArnT family glycosyltransferase n=1 Tax=Nakamurella lactea TaxID=459515 RepID=UPI00048AC038|nr:glycosyltransferase family 39 protein [Nakamurella lactea]
MSDRSVGDAPALKPTGMELPKGPSLLTAFVIGIPDRICQLSLAVILGVAIPVQLSIFHSYVVFPLMLLLAAVGWRLMPASPVQRPAAAGIIGRLGWSSRWAWAIGTAIAVLIAVLWFLINRHYYSELLSVRRDPSIYTLRGFYLMNHPSPDAALDPDMLAVRKAVPQVSLYQGGETRRIIRYLQSTTIVPGMIAVAGWIGGAGWLLQANVLIGAVGLVTVYAIARRMAGPWFGLIPVLGLAVSMPLAAFSRAPYTEPVSMITITVGLLGLWCAVREKSPRMWLLAGLGIGATALTRIDGVLLVIGTVAGLAVAIGFCASVEVRRTLYRGLLWLLAGAVPMVLLGYTDLKFHSPDYLFALRTEAHALWFALGGVVVVALLMRWMPLAVGRWLRVHRAALAWILSVVLVAVLAYLALRPLWQITRGVEGIYAIGIGNRQKQEGLPLDIHRSYSEMSVTWLSWYFGWAVVALAGAAVVAAVIAMIRRRNLALMLVLAPLAASALLYLYAPNITPDQIWAMRRYLPAVLPGMLLVLAWGAAEATGGLQRWWSKRLPAGAAGDRRDRSVTSVLLAVATAVTVIPAVLSWGPMFTVREGQGQYDLVRGICSTITGDKALILGSPPKMGYYQVTLNNVCGVQTLYLKAPDQAKVAKIQQTWGGTITVVTFTPKQVQWSVPPAKTPDLALDYQMWESTLSRVPSKPVDESTDVWIGTVEPSGLVRPRSSG